MKRVLNFMRNPKLEHILVSTHVMASLIKYCLNIRIYRYLHDIQIVGYCEVSDQVQVQLIHTE